VMLIFCHITGSNIDPRMQGAIFNGVFSLNAPNPVTCSTANCAWSDFATLAVCSTCEDVSAKTQVQCGSAEPSISGAGGPQLCNYTTPNGSNLSAVAFMDAHTGFASTLLNSTATTQLGNGEFWDDTLLVSIAAIMLPPVAQSSSTQPSYKLPPAQVTECTIRWCMAVYDKTSVSGNLLNTSNIRTFELHKTGAPLVLGDGTRDLSVWEPAENDASSIPGNSTIMINAMDHASTGNYLASIFTVGQATTNANAEKPTVGDIGSALLQTGNVSMTVQNMANSMSIRVRTGPNSTLAVGQALHDDNFIQVQWLWIIFPASTVFFGLILLILTIWRSARAQAPIWKSSSLAMLLHDMTGYYGAERYDRVEDMEKVAMKIEVRLVRRDSEKWAFERV
jgi:hypothetical protein